MPSYSTREAARKLGLQGATLARYIASGKLPSPEVVITGKTTTHRWTDADIENVRQLLPKIANGRKTRYQKLREKQKAQPKKAAPRKPKKKK
jgi:predicted DNA-binding transcriptional regulator AlpA